MIQITLTTNEQKQKAFWINESKKVIQKPLDLKQIFNVWTNDQSLIKDDIKIAVCWICKRQTITNHQSTCLNCALRYSQLVKATQLKYKDCCSMCGLKRKLVLDSNTCNKCLNNSF